MKLFLIVFVFLTGFAAQAQEPAAPDTPSVPSETPKPAKPLGRVKGNPSPPNDSSSFMGDPDNIDPLNPNRDNLKGDDEPVLEDIKSVLDAPKKKKKKEVLPGAAGAKGATDASPNPPPPEIAAPSITVDTPPPEVAKPEPAPVVEKPSLAADDPDLILERKFNEIFKRYNINPTPDDIWAAASSKQTARLYEVQKGDTLWSISKILFGDANFWPKLWALNKQGILNPHFINPKMKIFFYEGDEENAPTLTLGEKAKAEPPAEPVNENPSNKPADTPAKGDVAAADSTDGKPPAEVKVAPEIRRTKSKGVSPLPPSLPVSQNEDYFKPKRKILQKIFSCLPVNSTANFGTMKVSKKTTTPMVSVNMIPG